MNVYYVKRFNAVIVAHGRTQALSLLSKELEDKKQVNLTYKDINPTEFVQLDISSTHAVLLDDGKMIVPEFLESIGTNMSEMAEAQEMHERGEIDEPRNN